MPNDFATTDQLDLLGMTLTVRPTEPRQGPPRQIRISDLLANAYRAINAQLGETYTLTLDDLGKQVSLDNALPITLTVPPHAAVPFPRGGEIELVQMGAGQVTVAAGTGVTIVSYGDALALAGTGAGATLKYQGSNRWLLIGNLA